MAEGIHYCSWRLIILKTVQALAHYQVSVLRALQSSPGRLTMRRQCDPIRNAHLQYEPSPVTKAALAQLYRTTGRIVDVSREPVLDFPGTNTAQSQVWDTWTKNNLAHSTRTPVSHLYLKLET